MYRNNKHLHRQRLILIVICLPLCYAFLVHHTSFSRIRRIPLSSNPNEASLTNSQSSKSISGEKNKIPKVNIYMNFSNFKRSLDQFDDIEEATDVIESMERIYDFFNASESPMPGKKEKSKGNDKRSFNVAIKEGIRIDPLNVDMYNTLLNIYARSRNDTVALLAESVLYRMQTLSSKSSSSICVMPNIETYNFVLECWSNYCGRDRTARAEEILEFLEMSIVAPTVDSYNSMILAYLRSSYEKQALGYALKAQNVLDRMEKRYYMDLQHNTSSPEINLSNISYSNQSTPSHFKPDVLSYTAAISCWANVAQQFHESSLLMPHNNSTSPLEISLSILKRMEKFDIPPNVRTYSGIMQCLSYDKRCTRSSATFIKHLRLILKSMKHHHVKPNVFIYGIILNTISKCGTTDQCEQFFESMSNSGVHPNAFCFASIINSYVNSRLPPEEIVLNSLRLFDKCAEEDRNSIVYTAVINALTKLSPYDSNAASKATLLHNSMIELYNRTKLLDYRPTTLSFSAVINCWAKSNSTNRVKKACEEYYNLETWFTLTGAPSLCVTTVAQNAVLDAMARSSTSRNDFAWQCQLKFREITRPDQRSYGTVIFAYANTKSFEGALNATNVLKTMIENGLEPNAIAFTTTLNAFSKSYKPHLKNQVLDLINEIIQLLDWNRYELATNVALCTVLLDVFGKCGDINQVQELFKSRFIQQGINPTPATHHIIVSSYLLNGKIDLAQQHVDTYKSIINTKTYNLMLKFYSKMKAFEELDHIFNQMTPNVISYTTYIHALSKLRSEDAAIKAENIFIQMNQNMNSVRPNLYTYNALLNAWFKSESFSAPTKCQQIMATMKTNGISPDIISYTCLIGACARENPTVALELMNKSPFKFDKMAYFSILSSMSKTGDVNACTTLVNRMVVRDGIEPDRRMIDLVMHTIQRSTALSSSMKEKTMKQILSIIK